MSTAFDPEFVFETPRLYVSHFDASNDAHCDFLIELYNSEAAIKHCGKTGITERAKARGFINGFMRTMLERNGYGPWLVSLKPDNASDDQPLPARLAHSTPIGIVTVLRGEEPDCFAVPDIGFIMLPAHMRHGYTKEACEGAMEYTTRRYGVKGYLGMTDPDNEPALAVFRSLGFKDHGVLPIKIFGGRPGAVWTSKELSDDLSLVGF